MAFKSITEYNNDRYGGMFLLKNDGDSADVIILYQSINDVMVGDTHYIKSSDYNGYVQCLGQRICPACERGIRVQPKLFIPLYVVDTDEILFWDRSVRFQQQMDNDVFSKYANPSDFVFRITRNGVAGDINTRYAIQAVAKNNILSYDEILKKFDITMPDHYNTVCKDWSVEDYKKHLVSEVRQDIDVDTMPEYKLSPRAVSEVSDIPDLSEVEKEVPEVETVESESVEIDDNVTF